MKNIRVMASQMTFLSVSFCFHALIFPQPHFKVLKKKYQDQACDVYAPLFLKNLNFLLRIFKRSEQKRFFFFEIDVVEYVKLRKLARQ